MTEYVQVDCPICRGTGQIIRKITMTQPDQPIMLHADRELTDEEAAHIMGRGV